MNKNIIPFPKQQQVNLTENHEYKENVPWKLGRHVKPHHVEMLEKLVEDYKQQALNDMKNNKKYH
ncbi:hypothetical protein [Neobacillus ginsengisoli]|uniref:Uncharacterized protein n=1 Tax=Neobacillus ginsengisoli TaxID=904295 RepID=A0ABT9Y435_9BACI|nr:hypothetical protein [Neobacillus ginsengisoli]MDQ0202275.1 hypothetical protein [Neobacillus ginsengisoli]